MASRLTTAVTATLLGLSVTIAISLQSPVPASEASQLRHNLRTAADNGRDVVKDDIGCRRDLERRNLEPHDLEQDGQSANRTVKSV